MAALIKDRDTPAREGVDYRADLAANAKIFAGALVVLNANGYAQGGAAAAGLTAVGRALETVDNTGGIDGAATVRYDRGVFGFANDGSITRAQIGDLAYIVDDQTVAATDNAGARSVAGLIEDVDASFVWVRVGSRDRLTAVAALDFPAIAAAGSADLTINVPGAAVNDSVALGLPAAPAAGLLFIAFVSAAGVVTVRASNITAAAVDAAAASYRVTVLK